MGKLKKIKTVDDVRGILKKRVAYHKKVLKRLYAKRKELNDIKGIEPELKRDYMSTFIMQAKDAIMEIEVIMARLDGDYSSMEKNWMQAKRELPIVMKEMANHAKEHAEGKFR